MSDAPALRRSRLARLACAALAVGALAVPGAALADGAEPPSMPGPPPTLPGGDDLPTPTAPCVVPSLKGMRLSGATARLTRGGCRLGRVTRRAVAGVAAGTVASQSLEPGGTFAGGSPVAVVVSTRR